jgi:hypothetical protein
MIKKSASYMKWHFYSICKNMNEPIAYLAVEVANITYKQIQSAKRQAEDEIRRQAEAHKKILRT